MGKRDAQREWEAAVDGLLARYAVDPLYIEEAAGYWLAGYTPEAAANEIMEGRVK